MQVEHFPNGIRIHQSTYTKKVLKHFHLDNAHPLNTPMVVRSLDVKNDHFRPQENDKETLGPKVPYLSTIDAQMYFANCTRPYKSNPQLVRNIDACYLFDQYKGQS